MKGFESQYFKGHKNTHVRSLILKVVLPEVFSSVGKDSTGFYFPDRR